MIIMLAASFFSFPIKGTVQPIHTGPTIEMSKKLRIGQSFIARERNLSRIDVYMTTTKTPHSGYLLLRVFEGSKTGALLRTSKIPANTVSGDIYAKFPIKILHNSKGRNLYLEIDAGNVTPANMRVWFYSMEQAYSDGKGYANESLLNGDVQFRTYSQINFFQWLGDVSRRFAKNKPGFASIPFMYIALFMSILFVFAYMIAQVFEEQEESEGLPECSGNLEYGRNE